MGTLSSATRMLFKYIKKEKKNTKNVYHSLNKADVWEAFFVFQI